MRRIITIILLVFTVILNAQDNSEKAKEWLNTLNSDKIITEYYNNYKNKILKGTHLVFDDYDLDITDTTTLKAYKEALNKNFKFYIQEAKDRTLLIYSNYDMERLDKFINLAKSEPDFNKVLVETNFAKILEIIIEEHSEYIVHDIPFIVRNIKALSQPLRLRLIIDNDTIANISKTDLNLVLVTTNQKYKQIQILNRETSVIEVPKDLKYEEMEYVILTYNNEQYPFFENHYENLPKELRAVMNEEVKELHNPLAKSCFENLLYWEIRIDNDPNTNPDYELIKRPGENNKGLISFKTRSTSFGRIN
ncbi:hypothetical protein [Winogradskyella ludwigii]|uniref:hypothetical protein n=1 Tax=Winogradskyella ludwigii TaxID=2686076 RepID=UPI0015C6AE62|nr:hypothetical protein [Winogradskyella ludwigii]